MDHEVIKERVEKLSETLVFVDLDRPETLVGLSELFATIGEGLASAAHPEAAEASRRAAALAAKVTAGEVDAAAAALQTLAEAAAALQCIVFEGRAWSEVAFPRVLLRGAGDAAAEPAAGEAEARSENPAAADEAETGNGEGAAAMFDDAIVAEFLSRQTDTLQEIEKDILALEEEDHAEVLAILLRFFHTLKGESSLLGITDVAEVCHATEDMLQSEPPGQCVDRLLETKDWLLAKIDFLSERGPEPAPAAKIVGIMQTYVPAADGGAGDATASAAPVADADDEGIRAGSSGADPGTSGAPAPRSRPSPPAAADGDIPVVEHPPTPNVLRGDVDLLQDFVGEAHEHLDAAEVHLLTLEGEPTHAESLNAVFRAFHTIKGLAGFLELEHIKELSHKAESLLDAARRGEIELGGEAMDLVFESVDMLKRLVEQLVVALEGDGGLPHEEGLPGLLGRLIHRMKGEIPPARVTPWPEDAPAPSASATAAGPAAAQPADAAPPDAAETPAPAAESGPAAPAARKKCGYIPLTPRGKQPAAKVETPVSARGTGAGREKPERPAAPPPSPSPSRDAGPPPAAVKVKEAVRVDAERLDRLVETIGELVIAEAMVSQSPEIRNATSSVRLEKQLDHLDKICRELQEIGMSLRMVPVRPVFQKMARLVRDLSKKSGKKIEFEMAGEDTELDKAVVDKIGDPLVHMLRNAVDHGIETEAADRVAAGKPETATVRLRAFHKGGNICIEVEDDGRGLNRETIVAKAISRGLIREDDQLGDREIFNLVFEPGFSTAGEVTDISGRGVGMDVVRRNIEQLRGTVDIHSVEGRGSVFSFRLPLTLAIIEGMVVSVGGEHYIVPTLSVVRLIRPRPEDTSSVLDRGEMLKVEDRLIPLFRLGRIFGVPDAKKNPCEAVVVVVEDEGRRIGLLADDILGQQQIVIKSLGASMQNTDGVAGGAIMSDGNVALIVDVAGLARVAHAEDVLEEQAGRCRQAARPETEADPPASAEPLTTGGEELPQDGLPVR